MKRFILVALLVLGTVALFACGKEAGEKQPTKPSTGNEKQQESVSAGAVAGLFGEAAFDQAEKMVKEMTLEEKIGQMFLVAVPAEYDVTVEPKVSGKKISKKKAKMLAKKQQKKLQKTLKKTLKKTKDMIEEYHIGGVYLTEKNIENQKQATKLVSELQACASGGALYVAVVEEGGGNHSISAKVEKLESGGYMSPSEMAKQMTEEHVKLTSAKIAEELATWGINLNLAPVADLAAGKNVSYDMRCYGEETESTANLVGQVVEGMRSAGIAVTLKHFPGFGTATGDYTEEILNNEDSLMKLRTNDFEVYTAGIEAGADCVMVGSMAVSKITIEEIPAFLSADIVTSILREELGFDGVIMTPRLNQSVITKNYTSEYVTVEAVQAGCDMLVLPEDFEKSYEALLSEVRSGRLDEKVINTSVRRILQNKIERGILVLDDNN